jgi:hypothetical protein
MISHFRRCALALMFLAAPACSSKPEAVPVQGEAFRGKEPATGALIIFHPTGQGQLDQLRPMATVDDKGTFTPATYRPNDGVPAGEYGVIVVWPDKKVSIRNESGGGDRLQGRYSDPKNPKFTVQIRKGDPNKVRIELE